MNLERQMLPLIQASDLQILPFSLNTNSMELATDKSVDNYQKEDAELILTDI